MEEANGIKVVHMGSKDFPKTLESCLANGLPLLIEDIGETLDASLSPLL